MKKQRMADVGNLPNSKRLVNGEEVGIQAGGYLDKKGTTVESVQKLPLPPGMNIENQPTKDINAMPFKTVTDLGYPGDGWT